MWDPDIAAKAAALADERERRRYWREYDRQHPPPRRTSKPGRWMLPPWTGPGSAQTPVWIEEK
jgi:hypothetical protein